jgi:hypothetical protein
VAVDADIVMTFSEDVQAGTGNIVLFSGATPVASIPVDNAAVTIDGDSVTVDLPADLAAGTDYFVVVQSGAFEDLAGNDFAGITVPTAFNFTTAGDPLPAENVVDMAAGTAYTATDGVVDVFQYEVDSTTGRAIGTDGEVSITGFNVAEDRLEFVDAGDNLTNANFETYPGVSIAENPFADNTAIGFDPDEGVASLITVVGIQDVALDTIDYAVV